MLNHRSAIVAPIEEFAEDKWDAVLAINLSSDAAASMTGTALPMDGGWTRH